MKPIHWNEPKFGAAEARAVARVLKNGRVTEGAVSAELVERLKVLLGVEYVILTTSGAAALFLAAKAHQVIEDLDRFEVLVPDITMIASATSVELAGGTPVLVDIESERFCIDVADAHRKLSKWTRAIMPVHVIGRGCDMKGIGRLAKEHGLMVIEDAANALGSVTRDGRLGTLGDVGCFSLQANKAISCGHGGFVATNSAVYNEVMTRLKDFGRFDKSEPLHELVGYNFKFNDILAAVALEQLKRLPGRLARLTAQRRRYERALAECPQVRFPEMRYDEGEIPLYVDVVVDARDELATFLAARGIQTRAGWPPLHQNPPYRGKGNDAAFPVATEAAATYLWLPNGNTATNVAIDRVCAAIRRFYGAR